MDYAKNFVYGIIKTAPSPATSGTSLVLDKTDYGDIFPDPATVGPYNLVVWPTASRPLITNAEVIRITAKSDNGGTDETTLTIVRTQEGSSARSIVAGDQIALNPTAKSIDDTQVITAVPSLDHMTSGLKITLNANENQAFGDVCYINADGQAQLIDADAIASMSGLFMATGTISANADGVYLALGIARDDSWAWTVGGLIYGTVTGTSGNTLSQTSPTGTDDVVQIMGVATHADRMYFNPQLVQIERT